MSCTMISFNWSEVARKGRLPDALYLYACRLAWLRHGDSHALQVLVRAAEADDAEMRLIASTFLLEGCKPEIA